MNWVIKVVINAFLGFFKGWYSEEKAKAAEWNAAAAKARADSVESEQKMRLSIDREVAEAPAPETPEAWNSLAQTGKLAGFLLCLCLILPSCFLVRTVQVEGKLTVLQPPPRPVLTTSTPFTKREKVLAGYANKLNVLVDSYNKHARERNKANGYEPD